MRRVVVLGGTGFFGAAAVAELRAANVPVTTAARRNADLAVDAESADSLRRTLRPGDVVLDAAGPFQSRGTALAEAAVEVGFDLVDLADAAAYVRRLVPLAERAAAAGVRILPACSTASAVSHAMITWSGLSDPVRLTAFLVPTPRHTAVSGTAASLVSTVGAPLTVLRVRALAAGRVPHTGLLAPHQQVDAAELLAELRRCSFELHRSTLPG